MSGKKQQDIRRIEDVTDDEIVDAIAKHGMLGIDLDDTHEGNAIERACLELGLVRRDEPHPFLTSDVDTHMAERMHAMDTGLDDARLHVPVANYFMLTPREWACRLAGLPEASIAAILSGEPQSVDDLTDDEIHRAAFGSS